MAYDASNPYDLGPKQTNYEKEAGVNAPSYQSLVGADGNVKGSYTVDPTQSAAYNKLNGIAMSDGLTPWAQMQLQSNDLQTANNRDKSNNQTQGASAQAMQQLMATGGGSNSGAAAFLSSQAARNQIQANQAIGNQSQLNSLGIQATDATTKQNLLGNVAATQTGAQATNAQTAINDALGANTFAANRYSQQMQAYGAQQTANAQRAAAGNSKSGMFK